MIFWVTMLMKTQTHKRRERSQRFCFKLQDKAILKLTKENNHEIITFGIDF